MVRARQIGCYVEQGQQESLEEALTRNGYKVDLVQRVGHGRGTEYVVSQTEGGIARAVLISISFSAVAVAVVCYGIGMLLVCWLLVALATLLIYMAFRAVFKANFIRYDSDPANWTSSLLRGHELQHMEVMKIVWVQSGRNTRVVS